MARRILILEDDALLRKHLQRVFAGRGYEVHATGCVSEFTAKAASGRFDACLFDLSLPDGNGLDAWATARPHQPHATAVLMTAYGSEDVASRATGLGVRAMLAKPLDLPQLLSAVAG